MSRLGILKARKSNTKAPTPGWFFCVIPCDHMESRKAGKKQDGKRGLYNGSVLASFMSA